MMTIETAIKSAKDRGMIPFVAVIPVSPELLRDCSGADVIVGQAAAQEFSNLVRKWRQENPA